VARSIYSGRFTINPLFAEAIEGKVVIGDFLAKLFVFVKAQEGGVQLIELLFW
jgi:hypothetical protein